MQEETQPRFFPCPLLVKVLEDRDKNDTKASPDIEAMYTVCYGRKCSNGVVRRGFEGTKQLKHHLGSAHSPSNDADSPVPRLSTTQLEKIQNYSGKAQNKNGGGGQKDNWYALYTIVGGKDLDGSHHLLSRIRVTISLRIEIDIPDTTENDGVPSTRGDTEMAPVDTQSAFGLLSDRHSDQLSEWTPDNVTVCTPGPGTLDIAFDTFLSGGKGSTISLAHTPIYERVDDIGGHFETAGEPYPEDIWEESRFLYTRIPNDAESPHPTSINNQPS